MAALAHAQAGLIAQGGTPLQIAEILASTLRTSMF
jgi:hypothetical protein